MTGTSPGPADPQAEAAALADIVGMISELVPGWYGGSAAVSGDPRIRRRPWSIQIRPLVETATGPIRLVLKIPLWDEAPDLETALAAGPQDATRAEFETLDRIRRMVEGSDDPCLAAVRPVAYVPEVNAVVTEMLPSRPLRALLRPGSARAVKAALGPLGRWLRRFHDEVGGAVTRPLEPGDLDGIWDRLDQRLAAGRFPADLSGSPALLRSRAAGLAGKPVRGAILHGDLGPSNVLVVRPGTIAVIDPNGDEGPAAVDPAKLIAAMRTGPQRLATGLRLPGDRSAAERALLEGYGDLDEAVLRLAIAAAVADRWIDVETQTAGARRAFLPVARRVLGSELATAAG